MHRLGFILLQILGGFFSWLAWPESPLFFFIFVAWIPLLLVEDFLSTQYEKPAKKYLFGYAYLFFFTWNILTTWWLWYASPWGCVVANLVNSFLMCIPILLFHQSKKKFGDKIGYFSFIAYWMSFEYLHQYWELSWSWLNLGNVFSMFPMFIQWYEYTGVSGGTFWILLLNLLLFFQIKKLAQNPPVITGFVSMIQVFGQMLWRPALLLFMPIVFSVCMYSTYTEKGEEVEVVVLQPNKNPYTKFSAATSDADIDEFVQMSISKLSEQTQYLLWPETAIPEYLRLNDFDKYASIQKIKKLIQDYPNLKLITGASTIQEYDSEKVNSSGVAIPKTARKSKRNGQYFDAFNAALQFDKEYNRNGFFQQYKKSKLVPGAERMPYADYANWIEKFMVDLGGIGGSLGYQTERAIFKGSIVDKNKIINIAPVICYESIYGEYVTEYIRKGANFIFILTNDGWWNNTNGHRHHLRYASLRAIENRRSIARSANTGVSCFINQKGDILQATEYGTADILSGKIKSNDELTFYSKNGDLLSRILLIVSILLFLNLIVSSLTKDFRLVGNKRK